MTKNEFILEYTLRQGRTPNYSTIEELIRGGCFEDVSPETLNPENKVREGCHIILNKDMSVSRNLTLPTGFVVKVTKVTHLTDIADMYLISFECDYVRTFTNGKNEKETQTSTRQFTRVEFFPSDFTIISQPCSTLFAIEVAGKNVKWDDTPTKAYEYSFKL